MLLKNHLDGWIGDDIMNTKEIYTEKDFKLFEKICKDINIPVIDKPGGIFIDGTDVTEFLKTHKLFDYKED